MKLGGCQSKEQEERRPKSYFKMVGKHNEIGTEHGGIDPGSFIKENLGIETQGNVNLKARSK